MSGSGGLASSNREWTTIRCGIDGLSRGEDGLAGTGLLAVDWQGEG